MSAAPPETAEPARASFRHVVEYAAVRSFAAVVRLLGVRAGCALARGLGRLHHLADRRHARVAATNIVDRLGRSPAEARRLARRSFEHLFVSAVEILHLEREIARRGIAGVVTLENVEVLERALAAGKGVILLSGHLGNWEVLAPVARERGWTLTTAYRPLDNPLLDRWMLSLRASQGQEMVPKWGAIRPFLAALRRGGMIVLLVDQDARSHGILVPFLGRPASTIPTPAELALRTGAAIITMAAARTGPGFRHTLRFDEPIEAAATGDREADVRRITTEINRRLETALLRAPEQWLWAHRRWKSSPPAPPYSGEPAA